MDRNSLHEVNITQLLNPNYKPFSHFIKLNSLTLHETQTTSQFHPFHPFQETQLQTNFTLHETRLQASFP